MSSCFGDFIGESSRSFLISSSFVRSGERSLESFLGSARSSLSLEPSRSLDLERDLLRDRERSRDLFDFERDLLRDRDRDRRLDRERDRRRDLDLERRRDRERPRERDFLRYSSPSLSSIARMVVAG